MGGDSPLLHQPARTPEAWFSQEYVEGAGPAVAGPGGGEGEDQPLEPPRFSQEDRLLLEHRDLVPGVEAPAVNDKDAPETSQHAGHDEAVHCDPGLLGGHAVEIEVGLMGELSLAELAEEIRVDTDHGSLMYSSLYWMSKVPSPLTEVNELGVRLEILLSERSPRRFGEGPGRPRPRRRPLDAVHPGHGLTEQALIFPHDGAGTPKDTHTRTLFRESPSSLQPGLSCPNGYP